MAFFMSIKITYCDSVLNNLLIIEFINAINSKKAQL